jgi:PAS domain S-box-containing protein
MSDLSSPVAQTANRHWNDSAWARYGLAVISVATSMLLTYVLRLAASAQNARVIFAFFYLAVFVAVWFGGRGPAIFSIALSLLVADLFFLPADLLAPDFSGLIPNVFFAGISLMAVFLLERSRRAEREAHTARKSLETTLKSIGDAVISTDAGGRIRFMNPVAERLTGWPLAEARGRPHTEVFHIINELTRETVESPIEKVLQEGGVVGLANHTVLVARDGSQTPIEDSGAPIRDEAGRVTGVVLVFHDVSERRMVEVERSLLAAIVESSSDAIIGKTLDGIVTSWNVAAERMYGYTAEEAVGRHISFIVPPELSGELAEIMARLRRAERVERLETMRVTKHGARLDVSLTISPIRELSSGQWVGASTIARDITGPKRSEADRELLARQVEHERVRLKNLVGNVPGLVWEAWGEPDEANQRIDFVSDYVEQMLGYTVEEWLATPNFWLTIVHPEDRERAAREARAIFEGHDGGVSQFRWMAKDGRVVYVEAQSVVALNKHGEPEGMRGVTMDITARKASEERLRFVAEENARLLSHAQEVNRAKDEFLATLSHELRTPLTPILGWTHMIRSGHLAADEAERGISVIEKNARTLSRLINDLLDMSSILSGKMGIERATVELSAVVREAVETVRPQAAARSVTVEVQTGGLASPLVSGDRTRLVQVFWNLLNNAVKFSAVGGRVRVRVYGEAGEARVEVSDEGLGIAPEFLPHVFERFRQADMATTRAHGGLGLGLALVKSFVETHGGSVTVESPGEGLGSRFTVVLPALETGGEPRVAGDTEAGLVEPRVEEKRHVLLVEDARDTLDMLRVLFNARGYRATTCATPEEALSVAETGRFDIIVSDIGLPRIDGYELIERLRQLPHLREVPALALTGYASASDAEASLAAGFDAHVPKPVDPSVLAGVMEQLMRRGTIDESRE